MFKDIRFTAIVSVAIGVMAVLLSGCASTAVGGGAGSAEKALKITIPGEPLTIDPTKSIETNGGAVIDQVSEGIYRRNADNKIAAGVVEKVVKPTDNKTQYTFTIKRMPSGRTEHQLNRLICQFNSTTGRPQNKVTADDFNSIHSKLCRS